MPESQKLKPKAPVPSRGGSACDDWDAFVPLDDMGRTLRAWSRSHGGSCCWKCLANCYYRNGSPGPAACINRCQDSRDCD